MMEVYGESPHDDSTELGFWQQLTHYAAYIVLWLIYGAITIWLVFQFQIIAVAAAMGFRFNPWQVRAIDLYSMTFFFFAWLIGMIAVEGYLRHGVGKGQLWRRAGRVFLATLIVTAVTMGIRLVLA